MGNELIAKKDEQSLPAAQTDAGTLIQLIERAAQNPDVDIDKMERLLQMHDKIVARNSETAFNQAMADAQSIMVRVATDAQNSQTHSKYATYAALDRALRPIYTEHGFSLSFGTEPCEQSDCVRVICFVAHKSGHSRKYQIDMPADGKGAKGGDVMTKTHATGSAMSYGQRYLLKSIFNVAIGTDDDGNGANKNIARINANQEADLQALIEEVGADKAKLLRYFKIEKLEDLNVKAYPDAIRMLEAKRKQPPKEEKK